MVINLIVAVAENNVIGRDNKLLWRLPNDLAFFKNTTWGMPLIMGRKTSESMGKALRGRTNIVITRKSDWQKEGAVRVSSLDEAISAAADTDALECYVIGGGQIYEQAMPIANRIYLTRVLTEMEGDTFFPVIDEKIWKLTESTAFPEDEKHAFPYRFEIWQRK